MNWTKGWRRFARMWRSDTQAAVDEEIRFHFEQKVAEFTAAGMSPSAARTRAEAEFGDVESVRESLHTIDGRIEKKHRRAEWWESIAQDLKYVLRTLRRSPAFTLTVVATLALGLGANGALFSVLDQLYVLTPAGVHNADQVRRVYQHWPKARTPFTRRGLSYPEIRAIREIAPEGLTIASYSTGRVRLGRSVDSPETGAAYVEGNYFGVLGVRPELGRFFTAEESRVEGLTMLAVISHTLWQRQFNGDSGIIGRNVDLGSHRHVIIGVAGDNFRGSDLDVVDVWVPLNSSGTLKGRDPAWFESKDRNGINTLVHVPSEPTVALFNARATEVLRRVRISRDSLTDTYLASIIEARGGASLTNEIAISTRLAGVAAVILLIACANVVNLLLARASVRQREIAVRLALGVSRRRLLSQLLIESTVLALLSAGVALLVAFVGAGTLRTLLMPDVHWGSGAVNGRVAVFTSLLAIMTGFAAGLVPALQASRPNLTSALKSSVRDGGQRRSRLRSALLVTQAALSVVLLVGAGVFIRSLRSVEDIDTGFDTARLLYASVGYDRELDDRSKEIARRMPDMVQRIRQIPGVEKVAIAGNIPLYSFGFMGLYLPGRDSLPPNNGMDRFSSVVSPEYFDAVGMRVLRGRAFTDNDRANSEPVIAVDENLARNFWPGEDALTKCIITSKRENPCRRVVAIISPSHYTGVIEKPSMHYFVPFAQAGEEWGAGVIVLRTTPGRTAKIGALVAREISQQLGEWSRPRIRTMEEVIASDMRPWRVGAALFTAAGMLALLVAAVGVYSSISYSISQRSQEMGVRVALGATASNIVKLVVSDGVRVVAIGVAVGLVASLAMGSIVASMLYETSPRDPFVLVTAIATLLLVAVVACSIPAWRASRVDPLSAMRVE